MIIMSAKNELKADCLQKISMRKMTIADGCVILNKSYRTIERYLSQYKKRGISSVIHGNKGRIPSNKSPSELKNRFLKIYKDQYFDFNLVHALEKMKENENLNIPYETARRWSKEGTFLLKINRRKNSKKRPRFYRQRTSQRGILLQMDGSYHKWFGRVEYCLITVIDDATSDIYFAGFFPSETTFNCMEAIKSVLQNYGVFSAIYVDRAGTYGGGKRQLFCQFKRALEEIGINVIFANSPQAKGRVERSYRTFQDRLVPELRFKNIENVEDANNYLKDYFIPLVWRKRFCINPAIGSNGFKPLNPILDLKEIFCIKETRLIKNDHTFHYESLTYEILNPGQFSLSGQELEIRSYPDGEKKFFFQEKGLIIDEIKNGIIKIAA